MRNSEPIVSSDSYSEDFIRVTAARVSLSMTLRSSRQVVYSGDLANSGVLYRMQTMLHGAGL